MKKKLVNLLLCFALLGVMAACSNNNSVNNLQNTEASESVIENESETVNEIKNETENQTLEETTENIEKENNVDEIETSTVELKDNYVIGIGQFAEHVSLDNCREGFIEGLSQKGFKEGENLTILYDNAQTDGGTANQIYTNYLSKNVDMMVGIATPMAQAAYSVTEGKDTPIIFTAVTDPIAAELADDNGKPAGMITGTSDRLPIEDQLEMIRHICPNAKKIGILYTTSEVNSISSINEYKVFASNYGFEIIDKGIGQSADLPLAVDSLLNEVDVLTNVTDNTVVASLPIVLEKANAKNIPVFGSEVEQVKIGCVGCVGLDYVKLGKQTGWMAAKVLSGENIDNLPFETITESDLYLNTQALMNLGLVVDGDYLSSAKEVYDTIEE